MSTPKPITALNGRTLYIEYEGVEYYPMTYFEERTCRNTDTDDDAYFKCSECEAECSVDWCHDGWGVPSFCPNCGSKVVEQ